MTSKTEVIDLTKESPPKVVLPSPPSRLLLDEADNAIVSPNIIGLMEDAFQNHPTVVCLKANDMLHIQQMDKWSCGFRNLQMVLSSLLPELPLSHCYFSKTPLLTPNRIPSVPQLQRFLEHAWKDGWDPSGAQHYGRNIVDKASKIGAVEVSTCLSFLGINNTIVQFIKCRESRSQLGTFCRNYFQNALTGPSITIVHQLLSDSPGRTGCSPKKPLYLQWDGHSVVIVGVESFGDGRCKHLLVLDPVVSGSNIRQALADGQWKPLQLSLARLERKDCQIIVVSSAMHSLWQSPPTAGAITAVTAAEEAVLRSLRNS